MTAPSLRHGETQLSVPAATTSAAHAEKPFEAFAVGDAATFAKTITEADVVLFAGISGDTYPLHVDAEYAKTTRFGRQVAHGMLSASLLSTVNALLMGTPGGIYVEQTLRFRRPVFIGDTLTAKTEIVSIDVEKRRLHCATTVANQYGKLVIDGSAVLQKDRQ
jgi:3-hydroxybutyryl-CoA dehydratase